MEKKILFLGLDAAMPDLVKKFVAEGSMPNTAKLMEQGVFSRLETVFPPLTAAAWTAIVSGAGSGRGQLRPCCPHRPRWDLPRASPPPLRRCLPPS